MRLKSECVEEWKQYMFAGFPGFFQDENAQLHWYKLKDLVEKIEGSDPNGVWFRLVLLEVMLFEPYYPLSFEKDKNGNDVPGKKYKDLQNPVNGYKKSEGDKYLEGLLIGSYYPEGYVKRLRRTYDNVIRELNEVLKSTLTGLAVTAGITIAAGGLGMAGGTMAIVGGGAILGIGVGAGVGGSISAAGIMGKKSTILQSAKLVVSVREIFLNDEHDIDYSNTVYEQYVRNIADIEKKLVELKLKENVAGREEKKQLKLEIKNMEESVHAMKIAMKSINKFKSAFEIGAENPQK